MKFAAIVLCVMLVGGANAGVLDDLKAQLAGLGGALKNTANHLADNSKVVLQGLLEQLKQAGGQLLQSTALKLLENLGNNGIGKRELGLLEKLQQGMDFLEEHFKNAKAQAHAVVDASMEKLHEVCQKFVTLDFLKQPHAQIIKEIEDAVQSHSKTTEEFIKFVISDLLDHVRPAPKDKRFLKDSVQSLVDFFKPHVQKVTDGVKALGNQLKGHVDTVKNALSQHAKDLKDKLSTHVDQLKAHGQTLLGQGGDALKALQAAVTDILKQSLANAAGTGGQVQNTLKDGASTITKHLLEALKNATSSIGSN